MNFSIEKKGYSIEEVDTFLEDLLGKYQRLQAQNTELEQKLATAKRLIRRFSDTENALKQNIADSKRAAAYMISDAKDRSADLLDSARESCGEIISDLDLQIAQRMETISNMKAEVAAFKEQLFSFYSSHIEMIDNLAQSAEDFEYVPDYTAVAEAVDEFEAAGEPDCTIPEFVEYPEESIFTELADEEQPEESEEFSLADISADKEEDIVFEKEEEAEESEDFSQLILEEPVAEPVNVEEISFDISPETVPEEEEELTEEFAVDATEELLDLGEVTEEELEKVDDTDYFKFLNDFINSDDELDS